MAATDIDLALNHLKSLLSSLEPMLADPFSEADTRVKFIDPVLVKVLGWSESSHIRREERYKEDADKRCIDYTVALTEPVLVVEAKRLLTAFEIPGTNQYRFRLDGALQTWKKAWAAVKQCRDYCDHKGAKYGLVTNGRQFIAFKAISERPGGWMKGNMVVWRSPEELISRFTEFYQCLSREMIAEDRLSVVAGEQHDAVVRQRPRTYLGVGGAGGYRNDLYDVLHQVFSEALLDTPDPSPDFLDKCYCASESIIKYSKQLDSILVDGTPTFRTPVHAVKPGHRKDPFNERLTGILKEKASKPINVPLVVVMGGGGVGKTTFLQWYFRRHLETRIKQKTVVLTCDYRMVDAAPDEVRGRTLRLLVEQLADATKEQTGSFDQMKEVFRDPVQAAIRGELQPWASDKVELDKHIAELLAKLRADDLGNLKCTSNYLRARCEKHVIVVLDNIDQKDEPLQVRLFQIAQELVHSLKSIVILVLREATYLSLTHSAKLNAFSSIDFHVRVQPAAVVVARRLDYVASLLGDDRLPIQSFSEQTTTVGDIRRFLQLMSRMLLSDCESPEILRCIEAVSTAHTRGQLKTIYDFLVSGQTKVADYLFGGQSYVPFHEFLSSIILEDRKLYVEPESGRFLNIFGLSSATTASHFTGLRTILYFRSLGQEGECADSDFLPADAIFEQFEPQGIPRSIFDTDIKRLARFGLIVPKSQDVEKPRLDDGFAVTKCGLYYLDTLYHNPEYFAIMAPDTLLKDNAVALVLAGLLRPYLHYPKIPLRVRLDVAGSFLDYLDEQEDREITLGAVAEHPVFGGYRFVPTMRQSLVQVEAAALRKSLS